MMTKMEENGISSRRDLKSDEKLKFHSHLKSVNFYQNEKSKINKKFFAHLVSISSVCLEDGGWREKRRWMKMVNK